MLFTPFMPSNLIIIAIIFLLFVFEIILYVIIQVIVKLELKLLIIESIDIFIEYHYVMLLISKMIYEVL